MNRFNQRMMRAWVDLGPRFLPFADAATPDLPLSRLLRLALFQVSVGMAVVMLIGTLNRVMIVELGVPASLVAIMISLPLIFAPFRALIGFRSDTHSSALGWKRVPYIWKGTMLQFGGLAIMPFALLVLSGGGNSSQAPVWVGWLGAGFAFLLVGAGMHTTQTVGLALATDLAPLESQPKVVGLMYVMLLVGMIASALSFGALLADFTPFRLVRVIQGAAVATMILNVLALWKQETRKPAHRRPAGPVTAPASFRSSWMSFSQGGSAMRRLIAVGLGTMAFSMEDVLLEPYGGQILHLTVGTTTKLTATLAIGGLLGFGLASRVLSRGAEPFRVASVGALVGLPAFLAVILAAPLLVPALFALGTLLIGFGGGLFGHGTLTSTMNLAPADQRGLALGAWGAVQASAAGIAVALGGIIRDAVGGPGSGRALLPFGGPASGYMLVYGIEIALLLATLFAMIPLIRRGAGAGSPLADRRRVVTAAAARQEPRKTEHAVVSQAITRLYATAVNAAGAVKQLRFEGFSDDAVTMIAPGTTTDATLTILLAKWELKSRAQLYAAEVQQGLWLVNVLAPFGMGGRAEEALDRFGPVPSRAREPREALPLWDEAAPVSSALGIPTLYGGGAPDSSLGIPTLSSPHWSLSGSLGLPLVSKASRTRLSPELSHFYLSSKLGLPLLKGATGRR